MSIAPHRADPFGISPSFSSMRRLMCINALLGNKTILPNSDRTCLDNPQKPSIIAILAASSTAGPISVARRVVDQLDSWLRRAGIGCRRN